MVQIFQQTPDQGQLLAQQIAQGFGGGLSQGISVGLQQMLDQKAQEQKTAQLMSALGLSVPSNRMESVGVEIPQASAPAQSPLKNLTEEQVVAASILNPQLGSTLSNLYKAQQKKGEEKRSEESGQYALNRMSELLKKGNLGFGAKVKQKFGGETAEDVGEFESLSGALEALLVDKVSRGTLSNARFKYITETLLPKPNDREATIRGKLKALSKELGLETPELLSESKYFKKVQKGTKLSDEEAKKIFKRAGNDPDKARQLAEQLGYEF